MSAISGVVQEKLAHEEKGSVWKVTSTSSDTEVAWEGHWLPYLEEVDADSHNIHNWRWVKNPDTR